MADDYAGMLTGKPSRRKTATRAAPSTKKTKSERAFTRDAEKRLLALSRRHTPRTRGERTNGISRTESSTLRSIPLDETEKTAYLNTLSRTHKKIIRKQGKKDGPIDRVELTNFGKIRALYTQPARRSWDQLSRQSQERITEYMLDTATRYLESAQHYVKGSPYPRRLTASQVRAGKIPLLEAAREMLNQSLAEEITAYQRAAAQKGSREELPERRRVINGLTNRATILNQIIAQAKEGKIDSLLQRTRPRTAKKTRKKAREEIESPREMDTIPTGKRLLIPRAGRTPPLPPYRPATPRSPVPHEMLTEERKKQRARWAAEPAPNETGKELWDEIQKRKENKAAETIVAIRHEIERIRRERNEGIPDDTLAKEIVHARRQLEQLARAPNRDDRIANEILTLRRRVQALEPANPTPVSAETRKTNPEPIEIPARETPVFTRIKKPEVEWAKTAQPALFSRGYHANRRKDGEGSARPQSGVSTWGRHIASRWKAVGNAFRRRGSRK